MGEREPQLAGRDRRDQRLALRGAGAVAQDAAAENDGREIGLQRERAAERLLDQHGLDRAAAEAAVGFGERRAEQAEFGILAPELLAEAERARAVGLAALEARSGPSSGGRDCR